MKYLKLFEESSDDERLWHHISHHQYLHYLDNIIHIDDEVNKIKSIILNQNSNYRIIKTNAYIKASIKYNQYTETQIKIYLLPDEWYLVKAIKEFRLKKDYFYYKCDTTDGLIELMKWI